MKATFGIVNGVLKNIFKKPKTDDGQKFSAKGLVRVVTVDGRFTLVDQADWLRFDDDNHNELKEVFLDGVLLKGCTLKEIRQRVGAN